MHFGTSAKEFLPNFVQMWKDNSLRMCDIFRLLYASDGEFFEVGVDAKFVFIDDVIFV